MADPQRAVDEIGMKDNRLTKVESLQIALYQTIEQQSVLMHQNQQLQAEHSKLEEKKLDLAKQLGEARQREADRAKGDELE